MAAQDTAQTYLRTRVMTASPEELRLMLLDGAVKFATQAKEGLAKKDYEQSYLGFSQTRDIVLELMRTIEDKHDPELAERVRSLYAFMYTELVEASFGKDEPRLDKVIELLQYERDTWKMLIDQLAAERAGKKAPASVPAEADAAAPAAAPQTASSAAPANYPFPPAAQSAQRAPLSVQA